MMHNDYHQTYGADFFGRSDGKAHWDKGRLKVGDDLAAIAYALGIPSFERMLEILNIPAGSDGRDPDCTKLLAKEQVEWLWANHKRLPRSVLDVGGGRGEVSAAFAYLDIPVVEIEPHKDAQEWAERTSKRMFDREKDWPVIQETVPECLPFISFYLNHGLDTVIFCESLEHIPEDCFTPFWEKVGAVLRENHGMLIVANWLDYHPLHVSGPEHCRLVDDALYEDLAVGGTVVYRRGSHLVVKY